MSVVRRRIRWISAVRAAVRAAVTGICRIAQIAAGIHLTISSCWLDRGGRCISIRVRIRIASTVAGLIVIVIGAHSLSVHVRNARRFVPWKDRPLLRRLRLFYRACLEHLGRWIKQKVEPGERRAHGEHNSTFILQRGTLSQLTTHVQVKNLSREIGGFRKWLVLMGLVQWRCCEISKDCAVISACITHAKIIGKRWAVNVTNSTLDLHAVSILGMQRCRRN